MQSKWPSQDWTSGLSAALSYPFCFCISSVALPCLDFLVSKYMQHCWNLRYLFYAAAIFGFSLMSLFEAPFQGSCLLAFSKELKPNPNQIPAFFLLHVASLTGLSWPSPSVPEAPWCQILMGISSQEGSETPSEPT